MKILCLCLFALLILTTSLCIHFALQKSEDEQPVYADDMKLWGVEDAVPNEEVARKIADIIFIEHIQNHEIRDVDVHEVYVTFKEESNEWEIIYSPGLVAAYGAIFNIRKDNGMISASYY
ncbi:MAG: hypothetical protein FWH20_04725 [Oscillospiraceae bacterium]|nr:hypothetical protein [Oscillospiraceae bacterium]